MSKKVTFVRLHEGIHMPGVGDMGTVLPVSGKTLSELDMTITELGLEVSFKYNKLQFDLLIPSANIKFMRIVREAKVDLFIPAPAELKQNAKSALEKK